MTFSRGQIAIFASADRVTVLGPEDFSGYCYNNPSQFAGSWQLVEFKNGARRWVQDKDLNL